MAGSIARPAGKLLHTAPLLAFVLLTALLVLLGSRFRRLASPEDAPGFRLVLSAVAGALALHLLLTALDLVRVRWHPLVIVAGLAAATFLAHRYSPAPGRPLTVAAAIGWGDAVALLALAVFAFFAVSLAVTTPDFVLHWGLKGERFFLARGVDYAYMARPWGWVINPEYPNLLPEIYAATALLGGGFAEPVSMLWSVTFFGLVLLAARETLRQAGVRRFVLQATLATIALICAAAGIAGNMAGGADWMIALALVAAMPALLRPPDRSANLQVGLAAAFAAAAKIEGVALAAILVLVQGARAAAGRREGTRLASLRTVPRAIDRTRPGLRTVPRASDRTRHLWTAAALLLPAAAVVLPWQAYIHHYHLASPPMGAPSLHNIQAIGQALRYELTDDRTWHGSSYCLFLLPFLGLRRRLRPIAVVAGLQLLFYLYIYLESSASDPVALVISSFERLQLHLLPPILLAAGIALDPRSPRAPSGPRSLRDEAARRGGRRRLLEVFHDRGLVVAPALLALLLYARHLREGYLADDFLYAEWARAGLGVLLRHVTSASNPQMIRPLPALAWTASRSAWGAVILHGVSVLLHAAAGLLLAAVIRSGRRARPALPATAEAEAGERWVPLVFASLFVAFPLLAEPVIWLSASPDLWACCLALAALWVAVPGDDRPGRAAAAGALFLGALLAKESVLALPLIVAALWPWRQVRRTVLLMATAAGAYLAVRFALFAGLGGYLDSGGRSLLWSPNFGGLARNLALRLPFRVLAPVRRAGELRFALPLTILLSTALIGAFLLTAFGRAGAGSSLRRSALSGLARLRRPMLVLVLGLLPVLPILDIGIDQEGSRLLYFPAAMGLVALGLEVPGLRAYARRVALALVALWSVATVWNGRAWSEASREVDRTLGEMARLAPGYPAQSMIFVAGHDTWHGAYAWRNAIAAAARWRGLRPEVSWFLGTVAGVDAPGNDLGRRVFEIGLDAAGHAVDWTPCEQALLRPPDRLLGSWTWPPTLGRDPVTPEVALERPAALLQVRLGLGEQRPAAPVPGTLFWLPPRFGRFNTTEAASFFFGPLAGAEIVLRVPPQLMPPPAPVSHIGFWLHLPAKDLRYVRSLSVAEVPAVCWSPPRL